MVKEYVPVGDLWCVTDKGYAYPAPSPLVAKADYDALAAEMAHYRDKALVHNLIKLEARIAKLEAALRSIADDDCNMLFQDVAAIALGCTCTDYHRRKLITDPECPFHCD